jgi:hypothetical protein
MQIGGAILGPAEKDHCILFSGLQLLHQPSWWRHLGVPDYFDTQVRRDVFLEIADRRSCRISLFDPKHMGREIEKADSKGFLGGCCPG